MKKNTANNISHVVVLMFENRSFDHLLGAMPNANGLFDPAGNFKQGIYNSTTPLQPRDNPQLPFPISPGASEQEYIPDQNGAPSFNHDFSAMLTDLYGPGTTAVIAGSPQNNTLPTYPPVNCGFVDINDFQTGSNNQYSVMSYFEWGTMQVFHTLANQFVVCDNWFCDMPGHTAPNRAFMHCATTGALGIDDNDGANESYPLPPNPTMVYQPTIFEKLEGLGLTWKMYWPGANLDTDFLNITVANQMWTGEDPAQTNCTGVPLSQFCTDVQNNNLPFYSFIMCWNDVGDDTSMHPQSPVEPAENLMAGVYNTLRNSAHWEDTLLIVNFDENGGIYDHVQPPVAIPPYPGSPPDVWVSASGQQYEFDYTILGFRIPVLLISPWLNTGIDNTQFQNTSILRFLQDLASTSSTGQAPASFLTQRDRYANSIALVFEEFGRENMRTDCPLTMATYPGTTFADGICEPAIATTAQLAAAPPAYLEELTKEYIQGLPGHPDSGKPITRHFATVKEMRAYAEERRSAARKYYHDVFCRL